MDPVHFHLITNHIPILGSNFSLVLLIIGTLIKNRTVEIVALATLVTVAFATIPVYLSGEEAEHTVEHMQGISEYELEEHEEHAETTLWLMIAAGLLGSMALVSYKYSPDYTKWARLATVAVLFFTFLSMIPLALHGGEIIRSEIRGDAPAEHDD